MSAILGVALTAERCRVIYLLPAAGIQCFRFYRYVSEFINSLFMVLKCLYAWARRGAERSLPSIPPHHLGLGALCCVALMGHTKTDIPSGTAANRAVRGGEGGIERERGRPNRSYKSEYDILRQNYYSVSLRRGGCAYYPSR